MPSPIAGQSTGANAQHTPPPPPDNTPRTRAKTRMEKAHTPAATTKKGHIAPAQTHPAKAPPPSHPPPFPSRHTPKPHTVHDIHNQPNFPHQTTRSPSASCTPCNH